MFRGEYDEDDVIHADEGTDSIIAHRLGFSRSGPSTGRFGLYRFQAIAAARSFSR